MARIAVGSYLIRQPVGGNISWTLQWLAGLLDLGHDVFVLEMSYYENPCFDPARKAMTEDPRPGIRITLPYLQRLGLGEAWTFRDRAGEHYGMSRRKVREVLDSADIFLDLGTHGAWLPEAGNCRVRVLVDGEPGYTQMKMELGRADAMLPPAYDIYFSNGASLADGSGTAPDAGVAWRHVFNPVFIENFRTDPPPAGAPFTTVMNWQAHQPITYRGLVYGQKDAEFEKFIDLPRKCGVPMEAAISGAGAPREKLASSGWITRDACHVTRSVESYLDYIYQSAGEFSVCKNVFVAARTGWFSDRSAAYLACGRPVILQDTGFGSVLPVGEGLFAAADAEDAADAISRVRQNPARHSKAAREIAESILSTRVVLARMVDQIGSATSPDDPA